MIHSKRVLTIALMLSAMPQAVQAQEVPRDARIDALMNAAVRQGEPGCAAAVSRDGQTLHAAGYGVADLASGEQIGPETSFNMGSVSKQFTGYAITLLEEQGRLSLDTSVREYLPELPAFTEPVTLRQLLHHTGGIPNLEGIIRLKGLVGDGTVPAVTRLELMAALGRANQRPGTAYEYSNTGYFLLAQVVSRVSGEPFASFMAKSVFSHAGMSGSQVLDRVRPGPGAAQPYEKEGDGFEAAFSLQPGAGPSGVQASVTDMLRWGALQLSQAPQEAARQQAMREPGRQPGSGELAYARGLRIDHVEGMQSFGHQGAWSSYRADFKVIPDAGLVVAVACNRSDVAPWDMTAAITGIVLGAERSRALADDHFALLRDLRKRVEVPVPGLYRDRVNGNLVRIVATEGGFAVAYADARFPLVEEGQGIFRARVVGMFPFDMRFAFAGKASGKPAMVSRSFMQPASYDVVQPWSPPDATAYAGQYCNRALDICLPVEAAGAGLVVRTALGNVPLVPATRDVFTSDAFSVALAFDRSGNGNAASFDLGLPVFRAATFKREK